MFLWFQNKILCRQIYFKKFFGIFFTWTMKYARVLKGFLVPRWEFNGYLRHIKELIQILVYPCQFQWVNLRYKRRAEIFVYVSLIFLYVKSFFNCALLFQWTMYIIFLWNKLYFKYFSSDSTERTKFN